MERERKRRKRKKEKRGRRKKKKKKIHPKTSLTPFALLFGGGEKKLRNSLKIHLENCFLCYAVRSKEKYNFVGPTVIAFKQNHWILCWLGVSRVFPAQPVWVLLVLNSFRPELIQS